MIWMDFDQSWVAPQQAEVAKRLEQLLAAAEKNTRVKGKALEQSKDKIINSMRREFALAARAEWERTSLPMRWVGNTHPMHVVRVERLKAELHQWEIQREAARLRLRQQSERRAAQRDG